MQSVFFYHKWWLCDLGDAEKENLAAPDESCARLLDDHVNVHAMLELKHHQQMHRNRTPCNRSQ